MSFAQMLAALAVIIAVSAFFTRQMLAGTTLGRALAPNLTGAGWAMLGVAAGLAIAGVCANA